MPSRSIPDGIKRRVRQECLFGCVFCGMPVFEYEHIDDWALVQKHEVENIVLLCPTHHSAKTTGKLDRERIREQRANPYNKARGQTAGYKIEGNRKFEVKLADMHFAGELREDGTPFHVLWVNGKTLLSVRVIDGYIVPSFVLTDRAGSALLSVNDGELQVTTSVWDYTYEGSRVTIRGALRNILLQVNLSSSRLLVERGQFFIQGGDGFDIYGGDIEAFGSDFGGRLSLSGSGTIGFGSVAIAMINPHTHPKLKPPSGTALLI